MVEDIPCEGGLVHSDLGEVLFMESQIDEKGNLEIMEGLIFKKKTVDWHFCRRSLNSFPKVTH